MDNKIKNTKQQCACCHNYTITEIHETCPVCYWEEDRYQAIHIDDNGGPNLVSLRDAKINFIKFGAKEELFINDVRKPNKDEMNE